MRSMGKNDMQRLLSTVPLFASCSKRELSLLAGIAEHLEYPEGSVIFEEGEGDVGLHVIVHGQVRVMVVDKERRTLGQGAFFGEISLLDGGPRTATVIAASDVAALYVPAWGFNAILKKQPGLALKMLREVCRRIREDEANLARGSSSRT